MDKSSGITKFPVSETLTASEWVAKLDRGELSQNEAKQLRQWLAEDLVNSRALADQLKLWSDMDVLRELEHFQLSNEPVSWFGWFKKSRKILRPTAVLAISLSLMMVVGLMAWVGMINVGNYQGDVELAIHTVVGEQKTEALPDGSIVHVNTGSSAKISYSRDKRSVVLNLGEAFFDVAPEKDRPFVVYAGDTSIRAVGTAFVVNHNDNGAVSVSVTEGTVEFISGGVSRIITANEEDNVEQSNTASGNVATYEDKVISVNTESPDALVRQVSWHSGMLEFRGESLEYVVKQLSRYTNAQIVIMDDEIKDVRLGGYFKIGDMKGLASTLALGFDIEVDVVSNELIQLSQLSRNKSTEASQKR